MPAKRPLAALLALALALSLSAPAAASPETLKRSLGNILMAPLDLVVSPVVAGQTIYQNLTNIDDSPGVRIAYTVPGFVWVTGVQAGAAVLREVAGLLELLPGIGLLPFETDMDPLFPPAVDNQALVNLETPVVNMKFGIDYTSSPF